MLFSEVGGHAVMKQGVNVPAPVDRLKKHMSGDEVLFEIDLAIGTAQSEWLGCDLSREYVTINADYTT